MLDRRQTPYTTQGVWKLVREAGRSAGLSKRVSPHWLRHSFATLAARGRMDERGERHGADVFTLQGSLGHAKVETAAMYVHLAKGLERTAVDALPADLA